MKNNLNHKLLINQTGYTNNIPPEYFSKINHKGKITKIKYQLKIT